MKNFRMIHHVDQETIAEIYKSYAPVFVLSTGRTGSKFIVELLSLSPAVSAFHEPRPTLQYFSNFAFHHQNEVQTLNKMIDAARMEMILEIYINGKIFVESNQCLTFFAVALAGLFKSAKFVHLIRHPGNFVSSAARKGWYKNNSIWESGRVKLANERRWGDMDQVERLGWLWNFTNLFIRDFFSTLPAGRTMTCRLEDLLSGQKNVQALFSFCGGGMPEFEKVRRIQDRPVNQLWIDSDEPPNMEKNPAFPAFPDWSAEHKRQLGVLVGETARFYGYEI
jgi:hypothetical protein